MISTDSPTVLTILLDRVQAYAPEYGGSLSTHLPMALVSLNALGADASRMKQFFTTISARLNASQPTIAAASNDWLVARGNPSAFASLRAHFLQTINEHGRDAALRQVLPSLVDGVGAVAFHGLLRTASATVAKHDAELASGLAVWASGHLPLVSFVAPQTIGINSAGVADWLAHMAAQGDAWRVDTGMITPQMHAFVRTAAFRDGVDRLAVHDDTLRELATQALDTYLRTKDFSVLHLITSAHALRLLMPWLDEPLVAMRHYARAYAAGVAASGVKLDAPIINVNLLPWPDALRAGVTSDDEHVIKLVYACHEEWKVTGDAGYQRAASLVVA